jgi:hypothetical protein
MQPDPAMRTTRQTCTGQGVLPTPDPTVASCISDEDVARQLIALGDASNFSYGRTSASTLDDAFSGAADAASSTGATSDSESDHEIDYPPHKRAREYGYLDEDNGTTIKREFEDYDGEPKTKRVKTKAFDGSSARKILKGKPAKSSKGRANTLPKVGKSQAGLVKVSSAPAGNPQVRKISSPSTINQLEFNEEDLSSKPRCQRCRKSKKGCDRQRPCQRCKDAGIGIEGCVSEDEGNGRKGRYGRHMGVPVKTNAMGIDEEYEAAGAILTGMASAESSPDKGKKRKR